MLWLESCENFKENLVTPNTSIQQPEGRAENECDEKTAVLKAEEEVTLNPRSRKRKLATWRCLKCKVLFTNSSRSTH